MDKLLNVPHQVLAMNSTLSAGSLVRRAGALLLLLSATAFPLLNAHGERQLTGATTLSSKEKVSVVLDREKAADGTYIVLKIVTPQDVKIEAFMLPDPPRIVLDLNGASIKHSEALAAPTNGVVQQVRLGSHPQKLRVVVDLKKAEAPKYDWKAGKRQVILRMLEEAAPAAQPPAVEPIAQKQAAPAALAPQEPQHLDQQPGEDLAPHLPDNADNSLGATEEKVKGQVVEEVRKDVAAEPAAQNPAAVAEAKQDVPLETEKIAPPVEEKKLAEVEKGAAAPNSLGAAAAAAKISSDKAKLPASGALKIVGYRFEYSEPAKSPLLKVTLNSSGANAQISKMDSTTYKIVVPGASLANEDLVLPQFPPADFVGFIMVMSEEVNGGVEITISVEEGLSLTTMVRGDEIWVQAPSA